MIHVPKAFAADTEKREGEAGRQWIESLPGIVESLSRQWELEIVGVPMHGYLGLVVPVKRGDERCVLKISWRDESTIHEADALSAWGGNGAVRLLETRPDMGAMLLEWLDASRTLGDVGLEESFAIAGGLLHRLAIPASHGFPRLTTMAEGLSLSLPERWESQGGPFPERFLRDACELAVALGPSAADQLVHYDLHDSNVLAGVREPWLAVDPKVVVGDPEFGIAQLLWNRLEEIEARGGLEIHFQVLVEAAGLDADLARDWTMVRCVDYWLWGLSVGLTEDPKRCRTLVEWLMS